MNRTPRALQWSALVLLAPVLAACQSSTPAVPDGTDDAGRDQTDDAAIDSFPPPACGNGIAEPGEACDGTDLGAFDTCEDFPGFVSSGSVQCRPDCSGYDLSGCPAGTTTTLGSCDLATVQAAVDSAVAGETIELPACDVVWSGGLDIAGQSIVLQGQGMGSTVIRSGSSDFLVSCTPSADLPFRITGFTFDLQDTGEGVLLNNAYDAPSPVVAKTKIRIDHNEFRNAASESLQAIRNLGVRGVVDNNVFRDVAYPIRPDSSYRCGGEWWDSWGFSYGVAEDDMTFEDNEFTGLTSCVSDCQYANRYAFRYNAITVAADIWPLFDLHGNWPQDGGCDGCGAYSCFGGELYGNRIDGPTRSVRLLDQRGGKMLVFYNLLDVADSDLQVREEFADSICPTTNPLPQHVSDSYYWNNRNAGENIAGWINTTCSQCIENGLQENVDLFNFDPAFSGSTGIGCGPLADRPATCTPGVAYWATDQNCAGVDPANVGPHPADPISGTLFKCAAANTWVTTYIPLVYPHPLVVD